MKTNRTVFSYHTVSSKHRSSGKTFWTSKKNIWKILGISLVSLVLLGILGLAIWMQINVFNNLQDVSSVKDMQFSQSTIITDRNGVELYKLFEENREYVDISLVNQYMIDAVVALEDQRYWEHEGLDPWGIFRAAVTGRGGASTIPQQLMTNVFKLKAGLGASIPERVSYKLRQIVLSKRLNSVLQQQIKNETPSLSSDEVKREMKLKTLELYLNYIPFSNNAFGIEAAAKTYFGVPASELSAMQSAVLASIPNGPTKYNPLSDSGRKNLMGYFVITDAAGKEYPFESSLKNSILIKFSDAVQNSDLASKNSGGAFVKFVLGLGSFQVIDEGKEYYVKYINGRKDITLGRMFEDGYITDEELKTAFIQSLDVQFKSWAFSIKAPHFVFWIKEELEKLYGVDEVASKGLIVKTTLDYTIQQSAEAALKDNVRTLYANGANNSSMVYVDTDSGDILAYVGSIDYFNEEIEGQNDMVRNKRQSWSSIKPLIYSLGFQQLPLTIDTPIYDIPFKVGQDEPSNADSKFSGVLPLRLALGMSRNIPAVKMYLAVGGEDVAKPYLQSLGMSGILDSVHYGYPLALGAGETTMLELASAYSHLTTETPGELNPILEIKANDGSLLYQKEVQEKEEIIPAGIKYLMWKILSEPNNRLAGWVTKFNVSGLTYALKTGTSNVKTDRGNRPRDGWMAAYMPDRLVLMRAGNANASPMQANAFGGTIQADPIKNFLKSLLDNNYLSNREMTNVETSTLSISKVTGKIPADNTPADLVTSTMAYINSVPGTVDTPVLEIEYDALCLGLSSPLTPPAEIKKGYVTQVTSFMPGGNDLEDIKAYLLASSQLSMTGFETTTPAPFNILLESPKEYCEFREPAISDATQIQIIDPQDDQRISPKPEVMYSVKSDGNLKSLSILLDDTVVYTKTYVFNATEDLGTATLDLTAFTPGKHTLTVQAINTKGSMNRTSYTTTLVSSDKEAPYLVKEQSSKKTDGNYVLVFDDELSAILGWSISVEGEVIHSFEGRLASFSTAAESVEISVKDAYDNVLSQTLDLSEL